MSEIRITLNDNIIYLKNHFEFILDVTQDSIVYKIYSSSKRYYMSSFIRIPYNDDLVSFEQYLQGRSESARKVCRTEKNFYNKNEINVSTTKTYNTKVKLEIGDLFSTNVVNGEFVVLSCIPTIKNNYLYFVSSIDDINDKKFVLYNELDETNGTYWMSSGSNNKYISHVVPKLII